VVKRNRRAGIPAYQDPNNSRLVAMTKERPVVPIEKAANEAHAELLVLAQEPSLVRHEKTVRSSAKESGGPINDGNTQGLPSRDRDAVGQLEVSCTPTIDVDHDGLPAHFASLTAVTDQEPHLRAAAH